MLKRVVSNMHLLAKLSREAGFMPYVGHAHYIYACYLKCQINSSRPPSDCDLGSVWSLQVDLDKDMPKACAIVFSKYHIYRYTLSFCGKAVSGD